MRLAALACVVLIAGVARADEEAARRACLEGEAQARAGKTALAVAAYARCVAESARPEPLALARLAAAHEAAGHADEARAVRGRALAALESGGARAVLRPRAIPIARIGAAAMRADGRLLALVAGRRAILLVDVASGGTLGELDSPGDVDGLAFRPDGALLAAAGEMGVAAWDLRGGPPRILSPDKARALAFAPDGARLASGGDDGVVVERDVDGGRELRRIDAGGGSLAALVYAPDGKLLATGGRDGRARLWDGRGHLVRAFPPTKYGLAWLAFSPRGDLIAVSGSSDPNLRVYAVASGRPKLELDVFGGASAGTFTPDGGALVTVDFMQAVTFHRLSDGAWANGFSLQRSVHGGGGMFFGPGGRELVYATGDDVDAVEIASGKARRLPGSAVAVEEVTWSGDGARLAAGRGDGKTWLLDGAGAARVLSGKADRVASLAFAPDGGRLAVGHAAGALELWDAARGRALPAPPAKDPITTVAFAPAGDRYAAGGRHGSAWIVDAASGKVLSTMQVSSPWGHGLAFSPDGKVLASAATFISDATPPEGHLELFDVASGASRAKLETVKEPMAALAYAPDGSALAVGTNAGTVLLDPATGAVRGRLGSLSASALVFARDGKRLAVLGQDGLVEVWDAGALARTVRGARPVSSMALSPDGCLLALGTFAGTVELWGAGDGKRRGWLAFGGAGGLVAAAEDGRVDGEGREAVVWSVAERDVPAEVGWERARTPGLAAELLSRRCPRRSPWRGRARRWPRRGRRG